MRTLYHIQASPFSRRVRLALAHKRLDAELREARENPDWMAEARRLVPFRTMPVLVDGHRALGDSAAIVHWLDRTYDDAPRLWPDEDAHGAFEIAALVDVTLGIAVDLGTRYFVLHDHPGWTAVTDEMVGRAQAALQAIADRLSVLGRSTIAKSGWSAADMWLFTEVTWLEGLPKRAQTKPHIAQVMTLGLALPKALSTWADAHRDRTDVLALD
ncbi:MAG: glutathione S-transferase [Myxococcota bacterium]|nr:glutathione S-transferase [Myxococcota bacterium]